MRLICITGIDGTGKTTLARNSAAALREQGTPAIYIYGRTYPLLSRGLMALGRATMLRKKDMWSDYRSYNSSKKQTMRNPLLAGAYTAAILLDYYVQIWLKLLPHAFTNGVVVSDRYLYDTVISDLAVHLNYSEERAMQAIERGMRFLPVPTRTILIDVPAEVAFARKDDVPHVDYLKERQRFYQALASRHEVTQFNGEQSPEALVQALLAQIAPQQIAVGEAA
jgi:thymidylate kinase